MSVSSSHTYPRYLNGFSSASASYSPVKVRTESGLPHASHLYSTTVAPVLSISPAISPFSTCGTANQTVPDFALLWKRMLKYVPDAEAVTGKVTEILCQPERKQFALLSTVEEEMVSRDSHLEILYYMD